MTRHTRGDRCAHLLALLRRDVLAWRMDAVITRLTGGSSLGGSIEVDDRGWFVGWTRRAA